MAKVTISIMLVAQMFQSFLTFSSLMDLPFCSCAQITKFLVKQWSDLYVFNCVYTWPIIVSRQGVIAKKTYTSLSVTFSLTFLYSAS